MQASHIAYRWLQQHHVIPTQLIPFSGYTNYVFLVVSETRPRHSILRMGNRTLAANLSPLAHNPSATIAKHQAAVDLGLAPELFAYDDTLGIMWLAYAGQARAIQPADIPEIKRLLTRLHHSTTDWHALMPADTVVGKETLVHLMQTNTSPQLQARAAQLSAVLEQHDFLAQALVPVHGDLNPNNCLHDEQRWWLIDWDYAGQRQAAWDYASLIVEHHWQKEQARALAPHLSQPLLAWFCSYFALISWDWHRQRGSDQWVIQQKQQQCDAWFEWCL